ncbi:MAG: hypothetical protein ABTQ93_16520 [Candidatus Competibacter denitrificans]
MPTQNAIQQQNQDILDALLRGNLTEEGRLLLLQALREGDQREIERLLSGRLGPAKQPNSFDPMPCSKERTVRLRGMVFEGDVVLLWHDSP